MKNTKEHASTAVEVKSVIMGFCGIIWKDTFLKWRWTLNQTKECVFSFLFKN